MVEYRKELQPFHVAVATAKRRAEPTPDDWLDLPSDFPPTPAANLQRQQDASGLTPHVSQSVAPAESAESKYFNKMMGRPDDDDDGEVEAEQPAPSEVEAEQPAPIEVEDEVEVEAEQPAPLVESKFLNDIHGVIGAAFGHLHAGGVPETVADRTSDAPRASPPKLSPLPAGVQDLSRATPERADIVELRRLAALPPKNPRPKAPAPPSVFVGRPEHEDVPAAARATPPEAQVDRVIRQPGTYQSAESRAERIGRGHRMSDS